MNPIETVLALYDERRIVAVDEEAAKALETLRSSAAEVERLTAELLEARDGWRLANEAAERLLPIANRAEATEQRLREAEAERDRLRDAGRVLSTCEVCGHAVERLPDRPYPQTYWWQHVDPKHRFYHDVIPAASRPVPAPPTDGPRCQQCKRPIVFGVGGVYAAWEHDPFGADHQVIPDPAWEVDHANKRVVRAPVATPEKEQPRAGEGAP